MRFPLVTKPAWFPVPAAPRGLRPLRRVAPLALAALGALLCAGPRAAVAAGAETLKGKRVVVYSTVTVHEAAVRALEILEQAVAVYEENLPYRVPEGEVLVFHLYGDAAEYARTLESAGQGEYAQSLAATLPESKETHLVLQPRSEKEFLGLVGNLPEATRFFLCHEGARQFLLRTAREMVVYWPDWYGQGVASWLAEKCLRAQAGKDAPPSVFLDDRVSLLQQALHDGRMTRLDRLLHASQGESNSARFLYAAWHDFVGLLASDPKKFAAFNGKLRDLGPPARPGPSERDRRAVRHAQATVDVLTAVYGPIDKLDEARLARIRAATPQWFEFLRFTERVGDGLVVAGKRRSNAMAIRVEPAPKERFAFTGEVKLSGLEQQEVHLYLAYEGPQDVPRFLDVVLRADGVTSFNAFADGQWQRRYGVETTVASGIIASGESVPFKLTVDAKTILVEVGQKRVLDVAVPPGFDTLGNQVGIGVFDDVATFRSIATTPIPK